MSNMINIESQIKTYKTENAPMELVPFGIDEVANAPIKWKEVNEMIGQLTNTVYKNKKFEYTVKIGLVKKAIKEVNQLLKAEGLKQITTSKKTKEQLIDELELVCYQEGQMYGFTSKKNKNMLLSKKTLNNFARMGLLTPDLGASAKLQYNKDMVESIVLTNHNAIDARTWVNSAVETESTLHGAEALSGFGTIVQTRYTCDKNKDAAFYADYNMANCVNENGVIGYAKKNAKNRVCQVCKCPANVEWFRPSVSTKNGQFIAMPFIRSNNSKFKTLGMQSQTERIEKDIDVIDEDVKPVDEYAPPVMKTVTEKVRVTRDNIQPKLYPVHLQSKGGRIARKINGKTVWVDVFFQQLVFEADNGQCFGVWCAIECTGNESKKLLDKVYIPYPSRQSVIVSNSFLNNNDLSFVLSQKLHCEETIEIKREFFDVNSCDVDVEDGAGVV